MKDKISARFQEFIIVYKRVKRVLALSDSISDYVNISSINELRNSFDHTIRYFDHNFSDRELLEAEEHLLRTAMDCYLTIGETIYEETRLELNKYNLDNVQDLHTITNNLKLIRNYISDNDLRKTKNSLLNSAETLDLIEDRIKRMVDVKEDTRNWISINQLEVKKEKNRKNIIYWLAIILGLIGIISSTISLIIAFSK